MIVKNLVEWRQAVLEQSNHTCQICGSRKDIVADHIKSRYLYKKLELETDNGRGLCRSCHLKFGSKAPHSSKILSISRFFRSYAMQGVGPNNSTIRTSIPKWAIGLLLRDMGIKEISTKELVSRFRIGWHWNDSNVFWITLEEAY